MLTQGQYWEVDKFYSKANSVLNEAREYQIFRMSEANDGLLRDGCERVTPENVYETGRDLMDVTLKKAGRDPAS